MDGKPGRSSWGRRLLKYGLPLLLVAFAANHAEHWLRRNRSPSTRTPQVIVRAEKGDIGHRTIGIEESRPTSDDALFLRFATLGQWNYDPNASSPCPAAVQSLSGRRVSCLGFMYPLEAGTELKMFCLLRTTQTCCYGPRPQYNQYLLVEMDHPVHFERLCPVIVTGTFYPDAQPAQGFIYRLEGSSVTPLRDEQPALDPVDAARDAGVPLFDFDLLGAAEKSGAQGLSPELLALDGRRVMVAGYLLDRKEGETPQILVGKEWWDGVSRGKPPTIYTAVAVFPRDAGEVPPLWKDKGLFTGLLHVERDPAAWGKAGIVSLLEAERDPGASASSGPLLNPIYEGLLLCALLLVGFLGDRLSRRSAPSREQTPDSEDEGW